MLRLEWFYSRQGCKDCERAEQFLESNGVAVATRVDGKKTRLRRMEAFRVAKQADEVYAVGRRFLVYINLKRPRRDAEDIARTILGRTGLLKAPALRRGRTMIVGFDEGLYRAVLGLGVAPARGRGSRDAPKPSAL